MLVTLISVTTSFSTVTSLLVAASPSFAVIVYFPTGNLVLLTNVAFVPSMVVFELSTDVPSAFVTVITVSAGTSEANVATIVSAAATVASVISGSVLGASLGASLGAVLGASVGASLGAVLGASVGFVSSFVTVTATVAFLARGRSLVENMGIIYCRGLGAV